MNGTKSRIRKPSAPALPYVVRALLFAGFGCLGIYFVRSGNLNFSLFSSPVLLTVKLVALAFSVAAAHQLYFAIRVRNQSPASPPYQKGFSQIRRSDTMTMRPSSEPPIDKTAIRPFQVHVPGEELADLRRRIEETRWPERETVTDASQGVPLATIQELARYWATDYDWRKVEAKLNALPMFVTEIDGEDIQFIHVRSKHKDALPILITHGWPGSIMELLKVIDPLTNPTAYGGKASDAFDVVIPSLPGYGFSSKPTATGWGPDRIARAWTELMKRLGYKKYVAQGGDWGAIITDVMAVQAPPGLVGIHTNMPGAVPADILQAIQAGSPMPPGLSEEEKRAFRQLESFNKVTGYAQLMGTRPQTLTAFADSPVGLAAFMLDHDPASLELMSKAIDCQPVGLTRDDILDDITLYWLTNTGVSSARLYWENKYIFFGVKGVGLPVAVSVFPKELYQAPKSWTEKAYPDLIYYNQLDKGGHFAAWEQPELFVSELRKAFKSLR